MSGHTSLPADNWEIASSGAVGGGALVTGGLWHFQFRNRQLDQRAEVIFGGVGAGVGLKAGGTGSLGSVDDDDFTSLDTLGSISLDDLDGSWGWINSAGVAIGLGVGVMWITAASMKGTLFGLQPIAGVSTGLEGSINLCTAGTWRILRNSGIKRFRVNRERPKLDPWVQIRCRVAKEVIVVGPRAHVDHQFHMPRPQGDSVMTPGN